MEIQVIAAIVFLAFYAAMDGLGDAFIFRERRIAHEATGYWKKIVAQSADLNTNWHRAQAAQQSAVILVTAYLSGCWQIIPLGAGLFWMLHDGIVNRIGLDRPWLFVGTTAWIDRQFQKTGRPELFMGMAKVGLILAGIASFFVKF